MWVPVRTHHSARVSTSVLSFVDFGMVFEQAFVTDAMADLSFQVFGVACVDNVIGAVFAPTVKALVLHIFTHGLFILS